MCSAPPTRELKESWTGERNGSDATLRRVRIGGGARCLDDMMNRKKTRLLGWGDGGGLRVSPLVCIHTPTFR